MPGAADPEVVRALADGIDAPLNVVVGHGTPSTVPELAALGVARISAGSGLARAAHALVRRAARELLDTGTYDALADGLDYGELNGLLGTGRQDRNPADGRQDRNPAAGRRRARSGR